MRFVIHPDYVISKNDGDRHYIGVAQLMNLYQLTEEERKRSVMASPVVRYERDDIHLHPRYSGNYSRFWDV